MFESLTDSEIQILDLLAHGYSNHEIAENLNLAEVTVKKHVSNIYRKTYNQMESAFQERLVIRMRLILFYLKHIKVLNAEWKIKI